MAKRLFLEKVHQLFDITQQQSWFQRIIYLPTWIRFFLWSFLILLGLIGILTPIPFGVFFLVGGIILCLGIQRARSAIFRVIYFLRIHILYGRIYIWWKNRK